MAKSAVRKLKRRVEQAAGDMGQDIARAGAQLAHDMGDVVSEARESGAKAIACTARSMRRHPFRYVAVAAIGFMAIGSLAALIGRRRR